jgi:hypothetical protein
MNTTPVLTIETIIKEYLEHKERSFVYGKKRVDAEKEYNKLLTKYNGESKTYSLEQANRIYKAYHDMIAYGDEATIAHARFMEAEERLREAGHILFEASITAEIPITPVNGEAPGIREVTVAFDNGSVIVSHSVMS